MQVYIDLTGFYSPNKVAVPTALQHLMPQLQQKRHHVTWEVDDGYTDPSLVEFAYNVLDAGYVLGFGCLGGHGRTGWLAASLLMLCEGLTGDEAVVAVRSRYCHKAVETYAQCDELGCLVEQPSKVAVAAAWTGDYYNNHGVVSANDDDDLLWWQQRYGAFE